MSDGPNFDTNYTDGKKRKNAHTHTHTHTHTSRGLGFVIGDTANARQRSLSSLSLSLSLSPCAQEHVGLYRERERTPAISSLLRCSCFPVEVNRPWSVGRSVARSLGRPREQPTACSYPALHLASVVQCLLSNNNTAAVVVVLVTCKERKYIIIDMERMETRVVDCWKEQINKSFVFGNYF